MAFDPARSKWVGWLNFAAAVVTVVGLAEKISGHNVVGPLQISVPVPLWALLAVSVFGPTAALLLTRGRSRPPAAIPTRETEVPLTNTLSGKVDLRTRADDWIDVFYPRLFLAPPHLELSFLAGTGEIKIQDQRRDGFRFHLGSAAYGSDGLILEWKATGVLA